MSATATDPADAGIGRPRHRRHRSPLIDGVPRPGPVESTIKGVVLGVACALVMLPFVGIISTAWPPPSR